MKAHLLLGVAVALVLTLLVMMSLHDWTYEDTADRAVVEASPAIISYGITSRMFNTQGRLDYTIDASEAREYDYQELLKLTLPHITVYREGDHWIIDAKTGDLSEANSDKPRELILTGDVEAHQQQGQKVSLYSDELHYLPDQELLTSPGAVRIQQQNNSTRAGSMEADMKAGVMTLKNGVESQYAAPAS